jgi:opacity protein-like surface antigen
MVRILMAASFVVLLAVPALAQEDFPRIQTSMGYANLSLGGDVLNGRHSGFANETGFNLTRSLGLNNYMGIYTLGDGITLVADFVGGKASYRAARLVPYAQAGIGIGYFSQSTQFGTFSFGTKFANRFGGGVDIPITETVAVKVELSRVAFKFRTTPDSGWLTGNNFSTGIVFTLAQ